MCFSASYAAPKTRRKIETPLKTQHETDRNCPNYSLLVATWGKIKQNNGFLGKYILSLFNLRKPLYSFSRSTFYFLKQKIKKSMYNY